MSRIVLATATADLEERVRYAAGGAYHALPRAPLPHSSEATPFLELIDSVDPDVVVLDGEQDVEDALRLAALIDEQLPTISVVLVTDRGSEVGLPALRAGVRDIVHPSADVPELRSVLERAAQAARIRAQSVLQVADALPQNVEPIPTGRVISVVSPKGGVGKTTVSTNVAVGLAQHSPHSTVLVDLDVQFGDVGSALNLAPEYTLPDVVHGPASRDPLALKTFLTLHDTGLYVICGAEAPEDADAVSGEDVGRMLTMLASAFRYVVVDTAPGLAEHALAAMDHSTDLLLISSMDVPGVRGLRKELATLRELDLIPDRQHVVLNFTDSRTGMSVRDVEATIGTSVDVLLPTSRSVPISVNMGVPLVQSGGREPIHKQLRRLVERFVPGAGAAAAVSRGSGRHRLTKAKAS
jgi:pilus assembly protein CpaE